MRTLGRWTNLLVPSHQGAWKLEQEQEQGQVFSLLIPEAQRPDLEPRTDQASFHLAGWQRLLKHLVASLDVPRCQGCLVFWEPMQLVPWGSCQGPDSSGRACLHVEVSNSSAPTTGATVPNSSLPSEAIQQEVQPTAGWIDRQVTASGAGEPAVQG